MASLEIRLRPFTVPSFVSAVTPVRLRGQPYAPSPAYTLGSLPASTLAEMCDEFRAAVFANAGSLDPEAG